MAVMIALQLSVVAFAIWLPGGNAACPSFNIIYPPMRTLLCPGDNITYTCAVSSTLYIVNTLWAGSRFPCPSNNQANTIPLLQVGNTSLSTVPVSCGNLSAVMTNISGTCYTSVLTIPTPQYFNGTTVMCRDGNNALIGSDTLNIQLASPPSVPPNITSLNSNYSDQLTVTWTSVPTATSYNVSINDSVNTLVLIPSTEPLQNIFTGLTNNTVYTVSVVAINCAGNSSLATMSNRTSNGPPAPITTSPTPTPTPSATSASTTTPSSSYIAIGVGIGVGVGVPVLLALILVIVGVVYCTTRGGNKSIKIRNEESSLDGSHPPPSKPPRVKNSSPPAAEARKPAAKPSGEGLVYAVVNTAKGSGNKSAPPPANDGVTYSGVKH